MRQGAVISPLLFRFFNELVRALKAKGADVHVVNTVVRDDTCLLAESSTELRDAMSCVDESFHKWRLGRTPSRCSEVMVVRVSGDYAVQGDERPSIILAGENVDYS